MSRTLALERLNRPVDAASLVFFRIAFGLAMVAAVVRFALKGWIETDFHRPKYFFHYWGFSWVHPWPGVGMEIHYAVMGLAAAAIALGIAYRPACLVFALGFTYAHLCDKTNYLNHYYLVSLLAFLMAFLPLGGMPSRVRTWVLWLLRFQVGVVYVFGGIAKIGGDWLLRGEPLRIWLSADAEMPLLGRLFDRPGVAVAFSVCGMLFDLTVVPLLLVRRTRPWAYGFVLVFHGLTGLLFNIGMFPWLMTLAATLFFDASWPRRFVRTWPEGGEVTGEPIGSVAARAMGFYALVQILVPLRHWLYPGNTLWTEEGFRFAWKVMLIEKSGDLEFTVVDPSGRRTLVEPREYLTPLQVRLASTQPDMILELSHIVADDFARRGLGPVQVYADAQVSFNGRPRARLISPTVDLAAESDSLAPKRWILPAPTTLPEF